MTVQEIYYELHLMLNRNNRRENVNLDIPAFVTLFNREALRYIDDFVQANNSTDAYIYLSELIVKDYALTKASDNKDRIIYALPEDFFNPLHGDCRSVARNGSCSSTIYNFFIKPQDVNVRLLNKFTAPSLPWQRGLGSFSEEGIVIYKKDFDVLSTTISYYKSPTPLDMEGYVKFNGEESKDVSPQLSDFLIQNILDRVVTEVSRELGGEAASTAAFELAKTREKL